MNATPALVLVSWNGRDTPLARLLIDGAPNFDVLLFDYSGQAQPGPRTLSFPTRALDVQVLAEATQCKGDIYQALARHLALRRASGAAMPPFVGLIDDDVVLSINDINRLLHFGVVHDLHSFSAALSHDCEYTYRWTLRQSHRQWRSVPWVEVMMPFYDTRVYEAAAPHFEGNVSSWGIDKYLMPTIQQFLGLTRAGIIDAVMASHVRPISSGDTRFRNGLKAEEEAALMRERCLSLVERRRPELVGTPWHRQTFSRRQARTRWERLSSSLGRPLRRWLDRST